MANEYNNKIILGTGTVLIDLTGDTVAPDKLLDGVTAHDKSGAAIVGNVTFASVYTGSGAPDASLGENGDFYFDMG